MIKLMSNFIDQFTNLKVIVMRRYSEEVSDFVNPVLKLDAVDIKRKALFIFCAFTRNTVTEKNVQKGRFH